MLFRSRNRLKRSGRAFLVLVAGLWLTAALAPCAMAMASVVPMPDMNCLPGHAEGNDRSAGADVAAVTDCHLPDISSQNNLASPVFDIPATGVLTIPLAVAPVRHGVPPRSLRASVSIPEPPPLLRNSVLLI